LISSHEAKALVSLVVDEVLFGLSFHELGFFGIDSHLINHEIDHFVHPGSLEALELSQKALKGLGVTVLALVLNSEVLKYVHVHFAHPVKDRLFEFFKSFSQ
jgi:hypothetical protein